jgi:hypothetical protein
MPQLISIPTPCHENWDGMTANKTGKHCGVCKKDVIDFTSWQPQAFVLS